MPSNNDYDLNNAIKDLEIIFCWISEISPRSRAVSSAIDVLEHILNGDLVPVIHARWIFREADECFYPNFRCSNCHEVSAFDFNFCPNCGAKMEGA